MPRKSFYHIKLVEKIESVLRRMRWKAWFFLKKQCATKPSKTTYGDSNQDCFTNNVMSLKKKLYNVLKMVEFTNKRYQFDKVKQRPFILVFADKTNNIYEMNVKDYQKLLKENITVTYRKASIKPEKAISSDKKYNEEIRT